MCLFSIADIDDNDNFHQLCFSTSDDIIKVSMMANKVEDQTTIQIYSVKLMLFYALSKKRSLENYQPSTENSFPETQGARL